MKALLNTFETVWCIQMLWIDLIMIDLNEKFVLSVTGMEKIVQKQQWHDTTYELDKLYGSIPKLLEAVIAAGGGDTKH